MVNIRKTRYVVSTAGVCLLTLKERRDATLKHKKANYSCYNIHNRYIGIYIYTFIYIYIFILCVCNRYIYTNSTNTSIQANKRDVRVPTHHHNIADSQAQLSNQ